MPPETLALFLHSLSSRLPLPFLRSDPLLPLCPAGVRRHPILLSGRLHSDEHLSRDAHLASPFVSFSDPPPAAILLPQILLPSASATPQSQTLAHAPFLRVTTAMAAVACTAATSRATNAGTPSLARTSAASFDRVGIASRLCAAPFSCRCDTMATEPATTRLVFFSQSAHLCTSLQVSSTARAQAAIDQV
ncbi:unnamed protein product [Urochloa humidicola]